MSRANNNEGQVMSAVIRGDLNRVKEVVNRGVDFRYYIGNLLINAVYYGHLDIVKYLVKNGNGVYVRSVEIEVAEDYGHYEIAQFLKLCTREDKMAKNLVKIMLRGV